MVSNFCRGSKYCRFSTGYDVIVGIQTDDGTPTVTLGLYGLRLLSLFLTYFFSFFIFCGPGQGVCLLDPYDDANPSPLRSLQKESPAGKR